MLMPAQLLVSLWREILKRRIRIKCRSDALLVTILPIEHPEWNSKIRGHPCQHARLRAGPEVSQSRHAPPGAGAERVGGSQAGWGA
jgi:hypothetical protein